MSGTSFLSELKRRNVLKVAIAYIILSWLMVQVADVVFPALNLPDWSVTLVVALSLLGFLPVLIFAWVYELTPEGLERTEDVDDGESITPATGRKIDILIYVLSALVIGVVVLDRMIPERPTPDLFATTPDIDPAKLAASWTEPPLKSSIAVLPFVNMSADPDQEYFSDGLAEELLNVLSRVPTLLVTSRTSAFSFKDKDVTIAEIAKALNVAHILEGSVRKSGNRVRITAQLIDTEHDVHLWSETWDRTLDDVFAIQDDIARQVVAKITGSSSTSVPESEKTDPEAYSLYLQATYLRSHLETNSDIRKAIEFFEQALDIDPAYVTALSSLSGFYRDLANFSSFHNVIGREAANKKSREAAERILAINPEYAGIYAILASFETGDIEKRAQILQRGLQLEPYNRSLLNGSASLFSQVGRGSDAIPIYRYLLKRDPTSIALWYNLALAYFANGDFSSSEVAIEKALMLSPGNAVYQWARTMLYCVSREYQLCLDRSTDLAERSGNKMFRLQGEAFALPALGRSKEGAEALARLQSDYGDGWSGFAIAFVLVMHGRHEEVLDHLEKWQTRFLVYVKENPEFAPLHTSPRWGALMEKLNRSGQKLAEMNFEIELPE